MVYDLTLMGKICNSDGTFVSDADCAWLPGITCETTSEYDAACIMN